MEQLEAGLDKGWIPQSLKQVIEGNADFGCQRIKPHAWGDDRARSISDLEVSGQRDEASAYVLRKVKKIWLNARVCQASGRDENAWCMDVLQPLIKLAMRLEGKKKFWLQSV